MQAWLRSTWFVLVATLLIAAAVLVEAALARSASPGFDAGPAARETEGFAGLGFRLIWSTDLQVPRADEMVEMRVLDDRVVTVERRRRFVTALDLADGRPRWRTVVGEEGQRLYAPFRHGDRIYVNDSRKMYALDADTGRTVQINPLPRAVDGPPVMFHENAIYATRGGTVFAVDVVTADVKWQLHFHNAIRTRPLLVFTNAAGGLFVVDETGTYRLISPGDGRVRWHGRLLGGVSGDPVATEDAIVIPSHDTRLYALSIITGDELWRLPTGHRLTGSPLLIGEVLAQPLPDGDYLLVHAEDGESLMTLQTTGRPMLRFGDHLLFDHDDHLALHDRADGRRVRDLPATDAVLADADEEGRFVFGSRTGRILMVRPR